MGGRTEAVERDAGVVDDDVDLAVGVGEGGGEGVDAGWGADVELVEGEADGAALGGEDFGLEELGVLVEGV